MASTANLRHFETLVTSVLTLAATSTDMTTIKHAIVVLVKMVDAWAPPGPPSAFAVAAKPSAPPGELHAQHGVIAEGHALHRTTPCASAAGAVG